MAWHGMAERYKVGSEIGRQGKQAGEQEGHAAYYLPKEGMREGEGADNGEVGKNVKKKRK